MTGATVKLGATSLMYACQQGKESQVNEIIQSKPDTILERERSLKTALHYCAESGDGGVESAAALLRVAPELVFAQDQDGYTALHLAVIAGNVQLAKLLIAQGADVNTSDNEGHTSAHWATVCGEIECLELILKKKADPNIGDMHGGCPLHYAAQMCGPGSEMPADRRLGMTALRLLINHFANPNIPDHHGRQPILWAASAGSSEAILVLTNAGANVEAADKDGLTARVYFIALHCAASRGHTDCVETLISLCNAETDVIDNNGCSALFYAVTLGHADCTQTLLNHGSNTNRQDRKGRTAMHCGAAKGQMETLKVVWSRGGNLWTRTARGDYPLHEAVTSGRTDLVRWLLSIRPDAVNAPNNDGRCPLHLAAIHNNVEMCKVLLDAGSLVNPVMRTAKGMLATPLDAALHKGHRGTAKYLQVHGGVPAARLNSESAALRGPNTRNINVQSQKPLDNEKEKGEVGEQMSTQKFIQSSPQDNIQMAGQKQNILQVYVEDGVMIRRIKNTHVGEGEERMKRRRRRRKTKYTVEKSYLRNKDKHGRRGKYEESTDEDGYTSQESSLEELKFKTESDSDQVSKQSQEQLIKESSILKRNELLSKGSTKDNKLTVDVDLIQNKEIDMEKSEVSQSKIENEDKKNSGAVLKNLTSVSEDQKVLTEANKEESDLVTEDELAREKDTVESLAEKNEVEESADVDNKENETKTNDFQTTINDSPDNIETQMQNVSVEHKDFDQKTNLEKNDKYDVTASSPGNEIEIENNSKETEEEMIKKEMEMDLAGDNIDGDKNMFLDGNIISDNAINGSHISIKGDDIKIYPKNEVRKTESQEMEIESSKDIDTSEQKDEVDDKDVTESDLYNGKHDLATENEIEAMDSLSNEDHEQDINNDESKSDQLIVSEQDNQKNEEPILLNQNEENQQVLEETLKNSDINFINSELTAEDQQMKEQNKDVNDLMENIDHGKKSEEKDSEEQNMAQPATLGTLVDEKIVVVNENKTNLNETFIANELQTLGRNISNDGQIIDKELSSDETESKHPSEIPKQKEFVSNVSEEDNDYNSEGNASETMIDHKSNLKLDKHSDYKNDKLEHKKKDRGLIKVLSDEKLSSLSKEEKRKPKRKEWMRQKSSESWEPRSISPQLEEDMHSGNKSPTEPPQLQDSGIEPSPRREKYDQFKGPRTRSKSHIPRMCNKGYGDKNDIPISTVSVTQAVQYSVRKYHLERRIFHQLLELKRLQIRAGRSSEGVLVKRLVDDYRRAGLMLGLQQYNGVYTFRAFEKYLYDQLRLLQSSERRIIPRLKSSDDLEKLTAALRKTRAGQDILTSIPSNPALCTYQTHRCHHATHAYTGIPCAAYIKKNHHTMPKPGSFLPKLVSDDGHSELAKTLRFVDPTRPLTLELSHGSEKQVITLPTEKLDKSKRYFVTFTIKTGNQKKADGSHAHTHASSV